jgi:6-phosphogluconate dehydrogenase
MNKADVGLVGFGTMGAALALNIAEKNFDIAVWNGTTRVSHDLHAKAGPLARRITPTETLAELVAAIREPRSIILMVPAGDVVDEQIAALRPLLGSENLIINAGNANFHDTNRRARDGRGLFLGIGVSGDEEGARHGPSIMGADLARCGTGWRLCSPRSRPSMGTSLRDMDGRGRRGTFRQGGPQ